MAKALSTGDGKIIKLGDKIARLPDGYSVVINSSAGASVAEGRYYVNGSQTPITTTATNYIILTNVRTLRIAWKNSEDTSYDMINGTGSFPSTGAYNGQRTIWYIKQESSCTINEWDC